MFLKANLDKVPMNRKGLFLHWFLRAEILSAVTTFLSPENTPCIMEASMGVTG